MRTCVRTMCTLVRMTAPPPAEDQRTMRERMLAGGAIVLPGVTNGADTVVGAGSVVPRDLPAGVVAVGNPARVVRTLART